MKKFRRFLCKSFLWVLLTPFALYGVGSGSNQLVLFANHDKFPVMVNSVKLAEMQEDKVLPDGMLDDIHCVMTHDTRLNFLADVFDLQSAIYSIGDFAIMLGVWLMSICPFVWLSLILKKCWDADAV